MLVYISENRIAQQVRQLEGINDTIEEITLLLDKYSARLFQHLAENFGIRYVKMTDLHGEIATVELDISAVGRDYDSGDFAWNRLREGLRLLNPLAVTIQYPDIGNICVGLVRDSAERNFVGFAAELERIPVSEIQTRIEAILLRLLTANPIETTAMSPTDRQLQELEFQSALAQHGMRDPLEKVRAVEQQRRQQEGEFTAQQEAMYREQWGEDKMADWLKETQFGG